MFSNILYFYVFACLFHSGLFHSAPALAQGNRISGDEEVKNNQEQYLEQNENAKSFVSDTSEDQIEGENFTPNSRGAQQNLGEREEIEDARREGKPGRMNSELIPGDNRGPRGPRGSRGPRGRNDRGGPDRYLDSRAGDGSELGDEPSETEAGEQTSTPSVYSKKNAMESDSQAPEPIEPRSEDQKLGTTTVTNPAIRLNKQASSVSERDKKEELSRIKTKALNKVKFCKEYDGKIIAYYGESYRVKDCQRLPVEPPELFQLAKSGKKVTEVDGAVINAIPLIDPRKLKKKNFRNCKELDGAYVTLDNDHVFHIVDCKKRRFPDWTTFNDYRYKKGIKSIQIIEVAWEELDGIPSGEDFPSVLDEELELQSAVEADVIPIDEACKGIEGTYVSYYSRVYRIQKCHKRPVDPVEFSRKVRNTKITELSSEQWLSLPVGSPLKL